MADSYSTSETIQIQLTNGYCVVVDNEDVDLNRFKWTVYINQSENKYARRARPKHEDGSQNIHMHRVILERMLGRKLLRNERVDHQNNNGLDNRRSNLRLASPMQNSQNQRISRDATSGFKGINYRKDSNTWRARIEIGNRRYSLGNYLTAEDAACIYNYFAMQYFGEFAWFNPIPNWQEKVKAILSTRTGVRRDNTSGYTGVQQVPDGKWIGLIHKNKQTYYVGRFETPEAANEARQKYLETL